MPAFLFEMRLPFFILIIAVGLMPVLPLVSGQAVFAADAPSGCCMQHCQCGVEAACPCAASPVEDVPTIPAIPSSDPVSAQQLFDRDPQPLFQIDYNAPPTARAFFDDRPVLPTSVGQRLSLLCLRRV
jgi:hypothetical protein